MDGFFLVSDRVSKRGYFWKSVSVRISSLHVFLTLLRGNYKFPQDADRADLNSQPENDRTAHTEAPE